MATLRFPESVNGSGNDNIAAISGTIQFGAGGNDTFTSASTPASSTFIGGTGNDTYNILTGQFANIDDAGGSSADVLNVSTFSKANTTFQILNDSNILMYNTSDNTAVLVLGWLSADSKIETFNFSDGAITADALNAQLTTLPHHLANSTFEANHMLPTGSTAAEFNEMISFYHARAAAIETGTTPPANDGSGNDSITGDSTAQTLFGLGGNDTIFAGDGADTVQGNVGDDFIQGDSGDDSLSGGQGNDQVHGNMGNDTVLGNIGDDFISGGKEADSVDGGDGNDWANGNIGADTVIGGIGNDTLSGGKDNDILLGGDGNDTLWGNLGSDTMTGGAGADIFAFIAGSGLDVITDFTHGVDKIQVTQAMVNTGITVIEGNLVFTATDGVALTTTNFDLITDLLIVG